ncbi:MAG TPA: phosphoribosylamine--glycine ligase [Candidatus Kapabacteria bacterium]|nr:phosphoribosylamine--glycine ligase [Candidatus Kapabacteria bacterium]
MASAVTIPDRITVLLLGSGGREHALAWKLHRSPRVARLVCAPGNPGMAKLGELRPVPVEDADAVAALARDVTADLVVVGPEAPLAAGVADRLRSEGFAVFGPSRNAARLEWDKAFSKDFMKRHGIPTATSAAFHAAELEAARTYLRDASLPIVIKASGLAAGKGVVIATTPGEAREALDGMLSGETFGDAGATVVIEEFMQGEEASIFAVTDGERYALLAPSQDHKRAGDGDTGPNTGGMGAYAPAPIVTDELLALACRDIIEPTLRGMAAENNPYVGCLYVGVMVADGALRVVEFNSRFGDPETQVILPLLESDLAALLYAAAAGDVTAAGPVSSAGSAVCVVMAAAGYPGSYPKGDEITGIAAAEELEGVVVFHAGTRAEGERIVTNGGRVLGVTAISSGRDLGATIGSAYAAVERIAFAGAQYRHDIGARAAEHQKA